MSFVSDNIPNSTDGWGPQFSTISKPTTTVERVPYAPYQKGRYNKMKVADWTNTARINYVTKGNVTNTSMNFFEENGGDFLVVDRTLDKQKKTTNKQKGKTNRDKKKAANARTIQQKGQSRPRKGRNQQKKRTKRRYYGAGYGFYKQNRKYSPSVEIQPTWGEPILDIDFKVLLERDVSYNETVEVENLNVKGRVERFNDIYESLSARKGRHLEKRWGVERTFNRASTAQDPIMDELKAENIGNVYATDVIIATIMTTLKSVYGWDILIKKENGNIYLDKRADSPIDYLTVNENASDPPQEKADPSYNSLKFLHTEATSINQNFSQQVLSKEPGTEIVYGEGNPFTQSESCESAAYKYRKWNLGDIQLVGRAQFDAYKMVNDQVEPLLVKSLNEYDPKITHGWKKLLETLRNGVFSTQVQHNANKLSKWAIEAYLAEAYGIEIGYVSRYNPKDVNNHVVLGVDFFRTNLFMSEISGFSMEKMWGTFIHIMNIIKEQEDGNYILLRDPNSKILHLYKLNDEDFERAYQSA